jgi:hypothetical protein
MAWWLLGFLGGAIWAGSHQIRAFEGAAAKDIASQLSGELKSVKVQTRLAGLGGINGHLSRATIRASDFSAESIPFFVDTRRTKRGKLDRLVLELSNFKLRQLEVAQLVATIPACRYDLGTAQRRRQFRLSRSGIGEGTVTITEEALNRFILAKYPNIQTCDLHLANGWATLTGRGKILLFDADFRVHARLTTPDGYQIHLAEASITLDGKILEPAAIQSMLKVMNPVIDLNRDLGLEHAMRITKLTIRPGELVASGRAQIPLLPSQREFASKAATQLALGILAR